MPSERPAAISTNPLMLGTYTYVDGSALVDLILKVRDAFLERGRNEGDDGDQTNCVRLVAIDIFDGMSTPEQLAVLGDLLEGNAGLVLSRDETDIFAYSDTPAAYMADLVCEVVRQVLSRNPGIRSEDELRIALATQQPSDAVDDIPYAGEDLD